MTNLKSPIEWTDVTWSPVVGCTHVSAGCDHCYAATLHNRRYLAWKRGRYPTAPSQYHIPFKQVQLMPERLTATIRWCAPRRVFVDSMSDLFHQDVPDDFILQVWAAMLCAPWHTFQILTKRPDRMRQWVRDVDHDALRVAGMQLMQTLSPLAQQEIKARLAHIWKWPLPNVWLGTSVENQSAADLRLPELIETPAAVRFISGEPLLGPMDLAAYLTMPRLGWVREHRAELVPIQDDPVDPRIVAYLPFAETGTGMPLQREIDLVIVGGESGPHARPMQAEWARLLRDQCVDAGVAYFFKQWGGPTSKSGGRMLDGREWNEMPVWQRGAQDNGAEA